MVLVEVVLVEVVLVVVVEVVLVEVVLVEVVLVEVVLVVLVEVVLVDGAGGDGAGGGGAGGAGGGGSAVLVVVVLPTVFPNVVTTENMEAAKLRNGSDILTYRQLLAVMRVLDLNPGPLGEQSVPFTSEPSSQPQAKFYEKQNCFLVLEKGKTS
ncbi:hypothetical protein STEG23_001830, partial [Scotinomys teguina]